MYYNPLSKKTYSAEKWTIPSILWLSRNLWQIWRAVILLKWWVRTYRKSDGKLQRKPSTPKSMLPISFVRIWLGKSETQKTGARGIWVNEPEDPRFAYSFVFLQWKQSGTFFHRGNTFYLSRDHMIILPIWWYPVFSQGVFLPTFQFLQTNFQGPVSAMSKQRNNYIKSRKN